MDILDALRLASSADLYRLLLTVARLLDDPKRIIEIRRLLNRGMLVSYIADDIRINQKTASIQCDPNQGHWRVSFGLLRKIVDI